MATHWALAPRAPCLKVCCWVKGGSHVVHVGSQASVKASSATMRSYAKYVVSGKRAPKEATGWPGLTAQSIHDADPAPMDDWGRVKQKEDLYSQRG